VPVSARLNPSDPDEAKAIEVLGRWLGLTDERGGYIYTTRGVITRALLALDGLSVESGDRDLLGELLKKVNVLQAALNELRENGVTQVVAEAKKATRRKKDAIEVDKKYVAGMGNMFDED
jgi:hypothetical protein